MSAGQEGGDDEAIIPFFTIHDHEPLARLDLPNGEQLTVIASEHRIRARDDVQDGVPQSS